MKRPHLIPIVEITTRPPRPNTFSKRTSLPQPAEFPSFDPLRKRRRLDTRASRTTETVLASSHSPTISDLENETRTGPLHSPTVSEFQVLDTSDQGRAGQTPEDETFTLSGPTPAPSNSKHSTPLVASTSHSTLDVLEDAYIYEAKDDELLEDSELSLPGESPLDGVVTDDVPVRLLQDFTIYDMSTNVVVLVGELIALGLGRRFGASGIAKAFTDEDEDEDDDDDDDTEIDEVERTPSAAPVPTMGERINLSEILDFNFHHFSQEKKALDSKIYIRTKYAWYILDNPSGRYSPFFISFWIQHRSLHVFATTARAYPRITYQEFLESLRFSDEASELTQYTFNFLGRDLTQEDIESDDVRSYIVATLPDICKQNRLGISRVPAIKTYLVSAEPNGDIFTPRSSASRREAKVTEKFVLKHRTKTVITPIVSRIAKNLFKGNLEVAGSATFDQRDEDVAAEIDNVRAHHSDPESVEWNSPAEEGNFYTSVIMDGEVYEVGENVMVSPGYDEDRTRAQNATAEASKSVNSYANRLWFCKICYFYEDIVNGKPVKMFHGQWFVHGSKTILQETAHSKALYLINKCESNPVASIFKKCNVNFHYTSEPVDDGEPDANDFHCRFVYDEEKVAFLNIPNENDIQRILSFVPHYQPCLPCGLDAEAAEQEFCSIDQHQGLMQFGIKYHVEDFVYIIPQGQHCAVYEIGQIVKIEGLPDEPVITVHRFGRYDDYTMEHSEDTPLVGDERRLYRLYETKDIMACQLDGICYVRQLTSTSEIEDWVKHDNHFYADLDEDDEGFLTEMDKNALSYCRQCYQERDADIRSKQTLFEKNVPLVGLELFSGAGGLGTGMDSSGFIKTKYAVEFSPSAAITYKKNHSHTTVYCQDSNLLLKHALAMAAGEEPRPLLSNNGKDHCPPMPKKGEIDVIYGGPPCQSFSRANHTRHADDIRSTLPGNMLSYAEHYSPDYFLLENVAGLLDYPLLSTKNGNSLEGGIKGGAVKFIMRTLIALGYQVRYNLLQAGQYGAPQGRRRVIFLGAKLGLKLPTHPVPVYAFKRGAHRTTLPSGGHLQPVTRSSNPNENHQCAPLRPITVNNAIGDLRPFDWMNPHVVVPAKKRDKEEAARRKALGIPAFDAVAEKGGKTTLVGFPDGIPYEMAPQNRYQRWLRQGVAEDALVQGHYTKRFSARVIEATTTIPLEPGADHRTLPLQLQPNHARPGGGRNGQGEKKGLYGRMDGNGQFQCAMTSLAPNMKKTSAIHPSQKRIITVRECARAQGFPDHYTFMSADSNPQKKVDNQIRQIGNAVPVPLALALGKAIGEARLADLRHLEDNRIDAGISTN